MQTDLVVNYADGFGKLCRWIGKLCRWIGKPMQTDWVVKLCRQIGGKLCRQIGGKLFYVLCLNSHRF